jgi:pheromone shutdown protein TraB
MSHHKDRLMRALIHFPIIHSTQDLGSLSDFATDARSENQNMKYYEAVEQFWSMIETTLDSFNLNYQQLKLYQDGLPVCDSVDQIVENVASCGSQNFQLLQKLQAKGATLVGTESVSLLLEERQLMGDLLKAKAEKQASLEKAQALLDKRDSFIAARINETLLDDEMAVLFLGMTHNIEAKLDEDILLIQPLGKPI